MPEEKKEMPMFNGSIDTLQRINLLLMDCSKYRVNNNPIGHKANLFELYKETYGLLRVKQRTTAEQIKKQIEYYNIQRDEETGALKFDHDLWEELDKLDLHLRHCLHINKITFTSFQNIDKMAELYSKYGIGKDN